MEIRSRELFAWTVSIGSGRDTDFVNDSIQYGDGYEQIAGRGINTKLRTWSIEISERPWTEIRAIEDWLNAREGRIPFYFVPEDSGVPVLVRTDGAVSVVIDDSLRETLRCTFKEWRGN